MDIEDLMIAIVFAVIIGLLVLVVVMGVRSEAYSMPHENPRWDGEIYETEWYRISPPRPGLKCWATRADDGITTYCESGS